MKQMIHQINTAGFLVTILLLCTNAASTKPILFDYSFLQKELATGFSNRVEFNQVCDTPIVYRAWGVWNFDHPVSEIAPVALDFMDYPRIFRYVYRCTRITEPKQRLRPLGTYYVEGRAAVARVWAIGNIDSITWSDSSHLAFFASQNEDRWLEAKWGRSEQGWLNFRTHGVRIAAFVIPTGPGKCGVGIVAQGWVKKAMPAWLIRMAINVVLPQLLQDLETEVVRRAELKKTVGVPWYSRWYKAAKKLLYPNETGK
jgi:hypothetical protein